MRARDNDREPELTARPKTLPEEVGFTPISESGLSVEPEELGRQFLSDAVEQGNFESARGEAPEMWLSSDPPTDDALTGPNYEADHNVWESTASLALQDGGPEGAQEAAAPATPGPDEVELMERDDDRQLDVDDELDLTGPVIQEVSLLDHEGDELGETEAPGLVTDDNHTHAKRRGGHGPRRARAAARPR